MQRMLLDFLFLGQIPGTHIDLSFWQIVFLVFVGATLWYLNHYHYGWQSNLPQKISHYQKTIAANLPTDRLARLIGRTD